MLFCITLIGRSTLRVMFLLASLIIATARKKRAEIDNSSMSNTIGRVGDVLFIMWRMIICG